LLGFNRSNLYYQHREKDLAAEHQLRRAIDEQFMKDPCGVIKMMHYLRRLGHVAGEKLTRRLMRSMNLLAIYPKPRLSQKHPAHRIYPYLLKRCCDRPGQSGLGDRHHVYSAGPRVLLSGGHHGLV